MDVLDGLNPEQRRAAEAVRGPVCILAGAGSGKTTTITRRIAQQVAVGAFAPSQILAVTFTEKAAGVMKSRLGALGVSGVAARTFHSAALAQLHHFSPGAVGRILPTKALTLRQIANGLPAPFKFRPAADLATEIEWAKNQRTPPGEYRARLGDHEPPIPEDLMARVYQEYERRKEARGEIDFEDLLELAIRLHEGDEQVRAVFRERYRAFTVDEYQDVNLLQQTLLELWLGDRDDLCVVGDDYQSIYRFTGASPRCLLGFAGRFPNAEVVRLEENYRSSPEVLELANRLVPRLGGAEKVLRATEPSGPAPVLRPFGSAGEEDAWIAVEVKRLVAAGTPLEEIAVLARTNARLADFEEAFHDAAIPFQGSSLLEREAARRMLKLLERDGSAGVAERVRVLAEEAGMLVSLPDKLGDRELTRQNDLARLVRLAAELDELTCAGFAAELRRRFDPGSREVRRRAPPHLPPGEGARVRRRVPAAARRRRSCRRGSRRPTRIATRSVGSSTSGSRAPDGFSQSPGHAIRARSSQSSASRDGRRERSARRSRSAIRCSTTPSPRGASSAPRATRCRRTSSSTMRRWRRSPARSRARSASSRQCRASARRRSSVTATRCSPSSVRLGRPRGATRAGRPGPGGLLDPSRAHASRVRVRAGP